MGELRASSARNRVSPLPKYRELLPLEWFGKLATAQVQQVPVDTEYKWCVMPKLEQFLRIREAAEYLGVCPNTLRNWCRQGKVPEYRHPVNNYRLFKVGDLDSLLRGADQAVNSAISCSPPGKPT
jgi:excisionase family DNA binding protein